MMDKKTKQNKLWICEQIMKYAGKISQKDIADLCDVVPSTISKYASNMGVSLEVEERVERMEMIEEFVRNNHFKMTAREISDHLEVPAGTIYCTGRILGLKFKSSHQPALVVIQSKQFFNVHAKQNWLI
jgi:predicted transcriptional regulator